MAAKRTRQRVLQIYHAVLVVDFFTKWQRLEASVLDNKFSETKHAEKEAFSSQLLWEVCRFSSGAIKINYEN